MRRAFHKTGGFCALAALVITSAAGAADCRIDTCRDVIECPEAYLGGCYFVWLSDFGRKSSIDVTVDECVEKDGEYARAVVFAKWNRFPCHDHDCNESAVCPAPDDCDKNVVAAVEIQGSQEAFDNFLPTGVRFHQPGDDYVCRKTRYRKVINLEGLWLRWFLISFTAGNRQGLSRNASFRVVVQFYEMLSNDAAGRCAAEPLQTVEGTINIKVNPRTGFDPFRNNFQAILSGDGQIAWRQTIENDFTEAAGMTEYSHVSETGHSHWDSGTNQCVFGPTGPHWLGYKWTYTRVRLPAWRDDITVLPEYAGRAGWSAGPYTNYIKLDLNEFGSLFFHCNKAALSSTRMLCSSVELCPVGREPGEGLTKWTLTYDSNDRLSEAAAGDLSRFYYFNWNQTGSQVDIEYHDDESGENPVQTWRIQFDPAGRVVNTTAADCGGCGQPAGSTFYEYYTAEDHNDPRLNGLVKNQYNAEGDIITSTVYDSNAVHTNDWPYLSRPPLYRRYAVRDPHGASEVVRFNDWRYDRDNFSVTAYTWTDNNHAGITRYYYSDDTFSKLIRKVEYEKFNDNPDSPAGDTFTTDYDYSIDPADGTKTVATTYPSGKSRRIEKYDARGRLFESYVHDTVNGLKSGVRLYSYYGSSPDLYRCTDPRGGVTEYTYTAGGLPAVTTEPQTEAGRLQVTYSYDGAGRLAAECTSLCGYCRACTTYSYNDTTGDLESVVTDDGSPNGITDAAYRYDALGRVVYEKDATGTVTGKSYDKAGRLEGTFVLADPNDIVPCGEGLTVISQTRYGYERDGGLVTIARAMENHPFRLNEPAGWSFTRYEYDFMGRRTAVVEDAGGLAMRTSWQYDNQCRVLRKSEPSGRWTRTVRDGRGLVTATITGYDGAEGPVEVFSTSSRYDANGNLVEHTAGDGTLHLYYYDNFDRPIRHHKLRSDGPYTTTEYDHSGDIIRRSGFDAGGTMIWDEAFERDPLGRVNCHRVLARPGEPNDMQDAITLYRYDIAGNRVTTIHKGPGSGDLAAAEPNDVVTTSIYDCTGRLAAVVEAGGLRTGFTRNGAGRPLTIAAGAAVITHSYDQCGRLAETTNPKGHRTVYAYDSLHRPYRRTIYDCNGTAGDKCDDYAVEQLRFEYDNLGRVTRRALMRDPASGDEANIAVDMVTDYVYDPNRGLLRQQIGYYGGGMDAVTSYYYDQAGRLTRILWPDGSELIDYYDAGRGGRLAARRQIASPSGDRSGRRRTTTTRFGYDRYGRLHTKTVEGADPNGASLTTYFFYDALGRLSQRVGPGGTTVVFERDSFGNLMRKTEDPDGLHRRTDYEFDRLGRLTALIAHGTEPRITRYEYDESGRAIKTSYPDGSAEQYFYDARGRLICKANRNGGLMYFQRDKVGNTVLETDGAGFEAAFRYDAAGRLIYAARTAAEGPTCESWFEYNGLGLRVSETTKLYKLEPVTITSRYDCAGNLTGRTVAGETLDFGYDGSGRITSLKRQGEAVADFSYSGGLESSTAYHKIGLRCETGYDDIGRVVRLRARPAEGKDLLELLYTYDTRSNRNSVVYGHSGGTSDNYEYDSLLRLVRARYADGTEDRFTYNLSGSRIAETDRRGITRTYQHNVLDQYTMITEQPPGQPAVSYELSYDANGNLASDGRGYLYEYDCQNRLTAIRKAGCKIADFDYDAIGRRIKKTDYTAGLTTYYYYDPAGRVAAEYEKTAGGGCALARSFAYGAGIDQIVAMFEPDAPLTENDLTVIGRFCQAWLCGGNDTCYRSNFDYNLDSFIDLADFAGLGAGGDWRRSGETQWYYIRDALGSVAAVISDHWPAAGNVEFYGYDVYGQAHVQCQDGSSDTRQVGLCDNPYLFTARRVDILDGGSFKIQYNRRRYYSYDLGRWLNPDPAGYVDGTNLYEYARSRPTMLPDPNGRWTREIHDDATVQWAEEAGYPAAAAAVIGKANAAVDDWSGEASWLPYRGRQEYHFNRNSSAGPDSRTQMYKKHLRKAKRRCHPAFDRPGEAAEQLGVALHPYQDWVAHGDYGIYDEGQIWNRHNSCSPQRNFGDPADYPDDPTLDAVNGPQGRPAGLAMKWITVNGGLSVRGYAEYEKGTRRIELTERRTKDALEAFLEFLRAQGGCECRKYFGLIKEADVPAGNN